MALAQLLVHVLFNEVHGHVAGAFYHHLHIVGPGYFSELAQRFQLGKLRFVVGIGDGAGAQAITQREGHIVGLHNLANLLEVGVKKALLMMRQAPLGHDRAPARHNAGHALGGHGHVAQQHARVNGEVVHALLGLLDERVPK